jgi:uncharacterized protein YegP (UPF0339 family)
MANVTNYQVRRSRDNQYYWVLQAENGEIILTSSETYKSKQGCKKGIASSQENTTDTCINRLKSSDGQFYFQQIARNFEQLGRSELYKSAQNCKKGIKTVLETAPKAKIYDRT